MPGSPKFLLQQSLYDNKNLLFQIVKYVFVKAIRNVYIIDLTNSMWLLKMTTDGTGGHNDFQAIPQTRDRLCLISLRVRRKSLCSCGGSTAGDRSVSRGQREKPNADHAYHRDPHSRGSPLRLPRAGGEDGRPY